MKDKSKLMIHQNSNFSLLCNQQIQVWKMENDKLSLSFMAAEVDLHFVVILDVDVKVDHVQLVRRLLV